MSDESEELDRLRIEVAELRARDTERPEASIQTALMSDLISEVQGLRLETRQTRDDVVSAVAKHTDAVVQAMTRLPQTEQKIIDLERWKSDLDRGGCGHPNCPHRRVG